MLRMGKGFKYEVVDTLKEGKVWLAIDRFVGTKVCIKLRENDINLSIPKIKEKFLVEYIDEFTEDKRNYLVYKYVEGITLKEQILIDVEEKNESRDGFYVGIINEMVEALGTLHNRYGIVHNDLKPSNVIIDEAGHITLIDVIGTVIGSRPEKVFGTYGYTEFRQTEAYDEELDVFSFGKCVEEILPLVDDEIYKKLAYYCTVNSNLRLRNMTEVRGFLAEGRLNVSTVLGVPSNVVLGQKIAHSSAKVLEEDVLLIVDRAMVGVDYVFMDNKNNEVLQNQFMMKNISSEVWLKHAIIKHKGQERLYSIVIDMERAENRIGEVLAEIRKRYKYVVLVSNIEVNNLIADKSVVACSDCQTDGVFKKSLNIKNIRLICNKTNMVAQETEVYYTNNDCKKRGVCIKLNVNLFNPIEKLSDNEMKDFSRILLGDD